MIKEEKILLHFYQTKKKLKFMNNKHYELVKNVQRKNDMKKLYLILVLVLTIIGCAQNSSNDECSDLLVQKSHAWNTYHWKDLNPAVADNTRNFMWTGEVPFYVEHWASLETPIQPIMSSKRRADVSVVEANSNDWLGLAQIWISSGHIVEGKVLLNTNVLTQSRFSQAAAQHVLCQEIGHIWGLGHNRNDLDTCMNDCLDAPTYDDWLYCLNHPEGVDTNAHDIEQLLLQYDHVHENPDDGGNSMPENGPDCNANPNHPSCKNKNDLLQCDMEDRWITIHATPIWTENDGHNHVH
jgi:hypothetical protein